MYQNNIQVTGKRAEVVDPHMAQLPISSVYYPEDEISLLDIWLVLVRRRKIILAVFILCVLASVAMILTSKPVFQSRAVLEIGQVADIGVLVPRGSLIQRLREQYRVGDSTEGGKEFPIVSSIGFDKKSAPTAITITTQAHSAVTAQTFLRVVVDKIIEKHKFRYEKSLQEHKQQLDSMARQMQMYQLQVDQISDQIKVVEKRDPTQAALLIMEKAKLIAQQPDLADKRIRLSMALNEPKSKPTQLMRKPTLPVSKIRPKRSLFLVLGMIVGGVLAVFSAFFIEFIVKAREQLKTRAEQEAAAKE